MNPEKQIKRLSRKVENLEKENKKLKEKFESTKKRKESPQDSKTTKVGRRKFLKMLGLGAGSLAISSTVAGANWSIVQPANQGTSDLEAKKATVGAAPFDLEGSLIAKDGELIWDENKDYIPNTALEGINAEEKGTSVANFTAINFSTGSYVNDDGDGSVTVNRFNRRDPRM